MAYAAPCRFMCSRVPNSPCLADQGFFNRSYTPVGRGFDSFEGYYMGGESYYTHVTPYAVWALPGVPYWWTPSVNETHPAAGSDDGCGALVDYANDSATGGLRPASPALNGTHSTEVLATAVVRDVRAARLELAASRPLRNDRPRCR
jgi:hypothetical protein